MAFDSEHQSDSGMTPPSSFVKFDGNTNGHGCAKSQAAGESDRAVESFDGVFDDGQAQSGSANAAVAGTRSV